MGMVPTLPFLAHWVCGGCSEARTTLTRIATTHTEVKAMRRPRPFRA
jgi:hypothetical protein